MVEYYDIEKNGHLPLPEKFHELLEFSYLASQKDPFDPVEKEIKTGTEKFLSDSEHVHDNWKLVREYPLSKNLLALSNVWESNDKRKHVIAAKGSPEAIIDLCHIEGEKKDELLAHVQEMADMGLRILGVAKSSFAEVLFLKNSMISNLNSLVYWVSKIMFALVSIKHFPIAIQQEYGLL